MIVATQNMELSEYLDIMADNAPDFPEFAVLSNKDKETVANLNVLTGPCVTFRNEQGEVEGVGGIRIKGVGEAWTVTPRRIQSHPDHRQRQEQFARLLMRTQNIMKNLCGENGLWRVYGQATLSTKFLEQMGFERSHNTLIWSRTS